MADASKQRSWTKPAAMAIPKGGFFEGQGRTGTVRPDLPQDPRVLWLLDHREDQARHGEERFYEYAKKIEEAVAGRPTPSRCSSCTTCAGCSSINGETYFMYQGIFDTDFDKYTEDAVALFSTSGLNTVFENLEGFPEDWKTNPAGLRQVRPGAPVPELPGIRGVSLCERRRDQESAQAQGGILDHARPDAVMPLEGRCTCSNSTTSNTSC